MPKWIIPSITESNWQLYWHKLIEQDTKEKPCASRSDACFTASSHLVARRRVASEMPFCFKTFCVEIVNAESDSWKWSRKWRQSYDRRATKPLQQQQFLSRFGLDQAGSGVKIYRMDCWVVLSGGALKRLIQPTDCRRLTETSRKRSRRLRAQQLSLVVAFALVGVACASVQWSWALG